MLISIAHRRHDDRADVATNTHQTCDAVDPAKSFAVNGPTDSDCDDRLTPSAAVPARRGWEYDVITTARGRTNAMNATEVMLGIGDRFYVDQDAVLSRNAVAAVGDALAAGRGVHFATPSLCLARCASWLVRNYYAVWERGLRHATRR